MAGPRQLPGSSRVELMPFLLGLVNGFANFLDTFPDNLRRLAVLFPLYEAKQSDDDECDDENQDAASAFYVLRAVAAVFFRVARVAF
jgi:hypothetical protein